MITVYLLPVIYIDGTEQVAGTDIIHDGLLLTTEDPNYRKLIMNTTAEEHEDLSLFAIEARDATQEEIDLYNAQVVILPPDPDAIRAKEILTTSPDAIAMPEIWELLRIYGRRFGYRF